MSRQQSLARLGLGRSAFEEESSSSSIPGSAGPEPSNVASASDASASSQSNHRQLSRTSRVQQYDSKGRPTRPETEARNAAYRDAQNEVLALVGVVDVDELTLEATQDDLQRGPAGAGANTVRVDRHGFIGFETLRAILLSWPEAILARCLAGLYPSSITFAEIISYEISSLRSSSGAIDLLSRLLPGAPLRIVLLILRPILEGYVQKIGHFIISRLYARPPPDDVSFGTGEEYFHLLLSVEPTRDLIGFIIEELLLPCELFSECQRLGLASPWSTSFSLRAFLGSGSMLAAFMFGPWNLPALVLSFRGSAACLYGRDFEAARVVQDESSRGRYWTLYTLASTETPAHHPFFLDPALRTGASIRTRILRRMVPPSRRSARSPTSPSSRLPLTLFTNTMNHTLLRIFLLPISTILYRTVARAYILSSTLPLLDRSLPGSKPCWHPRAFSQLGGLRWASRVGLALVGIIGLDFGLWAGFTGLWTWWRGERLTFREEYDREVAYRPREEDGRRGEDVEGLGDGWQRDWTEEERRRFAAAWEATLASIDRE